LIEEECDGCGDTDGREEGVGATVVAGGDTPPVLEFGEEVLDFVALAVECLVVVERRFTIAPWRNAGFCSTRFERFAEVVAVISLVGDQRSGFWERVDISRAPL
jgi:hypothetical protein